MTAPRFSGGDDQHVTAGAEQIVVTTRDGRDLPATLLGEDPLTDIAVLRVDARNLPVAPRGSSADLAIGEWVVAIGNPYGYLLGDTEPTVTAGVVSALNRNLLPSREQTGVYVGMIQTDAPINPGNSGGPLVNAVGEVVGVNSSILSESGGSVGIGFAIPIERALRVARELERHADRRDRRRHPARHGPQAGRRGHPGESGADRERPGAAARAPGGGGRRRRHALVRARRPHRPHDVLCEVGNARGLGRTAAPVEIHTAPRRRQRSVSLALTHRQGVAGGAAAMLVGVRRYGGREHLLRSTPTW
jgi:serine protease Do